MTALAPRLTTPARTIAAPKPRSATKTDSPAATRPNYVAIYTSSIFAMSVLFTVAVGLPLSMYLDNWSAGFGLGAFCAFWGGPSFGVMAGAARVSAWFEEHGDH